MDNNLPEGFIKEMESTLGGDLARQLIEALVATEPVVTVRVNRAKPAEIAGEPVAWCREGRYLSARPSFTLDPALHQGRYYVQDASSMFISHVIASLTEGQGPLVYLDACAAPGGKTTAAIDALPAGSTVIANEFVPSRAAVLRENVTKWGNPLTIITRADTSQLAEALPAGADIVAADVPCSGEGMMRKDSEAVAQWSPRLVEECVERQREIVDNLWRVLKPGGLFIYSTCTFNLDENERMVAYIADSLGGQGVKVDIEGMEGIGRELTGGLPCYRFMPHRVKGEGLFMAVLRKPGTPEPGASKPRRRDKGGRRDKRPTIAMPREWIADPSLTLTLEGDRVNAVAPALEQPLEALRRHGVDVIAHGVNVATVKGRDIIPSQGLAMSTMLAPDAFTRVEVDRDTALDYLRRQAVTLPEGTPRGYTLLTHQGYPLGFVKNLGNRANNLYPSPWRILH